MSKNTEFNNYRLAVIHPVKKYLQWEESQVKYHIYYKMKELLENNCKVRTPIKFLKEIRPLENV